MHTQHMLVQLIDFRTSESEKLLGLVVNNSLTWRHYLSGESWRQSPGENYLGLFKQLSQRVGMLRQLAQVVPKEKLKMLSQGIFTSKLLYCIQVFGNVWGFDGYNEISRKSTSFTKEDSRRLQVLQNSVFRLLTGLGFDTPTAELVNSCDELSIHQLVAYHTLVTVFKVKSTGKPKYLDQRLPFRNYGSESVLLRRQANMIMINQQLNIARDGFIYRGGLLWNQLPEDVRCQQSLSKFKKLARSWVSQNVQIKPG